MIKQIIKFLWCIAKMPNKHLKKLKFKNTCQGAVSVLVNGPSLKNVLTDYDEKKIDITSDSIFVNLAALDKRFFEIKPKHYCFADPMFYRDYLPKKEKIREMYNLLNEKVDWKMNVYVCFFTENENKQFLNYAKITNPNIKIIFLNRNHCSILKEGLRNRLYDSGYFMPEVGSVANLAVYVAIMLGYKDVHLFGADNNMFLEFCVNDNNELCSYDSHFYDKQQPVMKPFISTCATDGRVWRIHSYMMCLYVMFFSHDLLSKFAKYKNARVINECPESMIDSYERVPRKQNANAL